MTRSHEHRRLMMQTRQRLDIEHLREGFEPIQENPIFRVKCIRCGKIYRLNQQSAHMEHAVMHRVSDAQMRSLDKGQKWAIKIKGKHIRIVRIVFVMTGPANHTKPRWLVENKFGGRRWWIMNPDRFLWKDD